MKRAFLLLAFGLFLTTTEKVSAQVGTSLQFNQVLYIASGTVPVGKVWKIERIINASQWTDRIPLINGGTIGTMEQNDTGISMSNGTSRAAMFSGPIWLPENSTVGGSGLRYSIIEFTVVP